jgi:hypothetical protein
MTKLLRCSKEGGRKSLAGQQGACSVWEWEQSVHSGKSVSLEENHIPVIARRQLSRLQIMTEVMTEF